MIVDDPPEWIITQLQSRFRINAKLFVNGHNNKLQIIILSNKAFQLTLGRYLHSSLNFESS